MRRPAAGPGAAVAGGERTRPVEAAGLASTAQPRSAAKARQSARHIGHVEHFENAASRHVAQNSWPHGRRPRRVSAQQGTRDIAHSASSAVVARARQRDAADARSASSVLWAARYGLPAHSLDLLAADSI